MAPQRLEKIESGPGNGMDSEASNPQDMVHGRAADRARLLTDDPRMTKLQKKAPNALKSLDAELKSAPAADSSGPPKGPPRRHQQERINRPVSPE
jgi:hypothetical protein